jgi:DNA-binding LytR/AlgR family response regulator
MTRTINALIAEDEPLLARALQAELTRAWPALAIVATVGDGASAVLAALEHQPDVLFFDIRMPGMTGLEAAAELVDAWPANGGKPFPQLVFVTAYDQYAVQAFEAQAVDYLLKPIQTARLAKTVQKLQLALVDTAPAAIKLEANLESTLAQLRGLLAMQSPATATAAAPARLTVIQASVGSSLHMVPVAEVLYLEAADKYVRVLTAQREYLIRTPLKELLDQLDPEAFWQVHRGTVVQAAAIAAVTRDDTGRLTIALRGHADKLPVSRMYAHRFKAM